MSLCERRFSPLSFLSGSGGSSSSKPPTTPSSSAPAYGDFEDSLRRRLLSLLPPPPPEPANHVVPLAYLSRAVGVLTSTHAEAARLLKGHSPVDADALSAYFGTSAGVLELCNAASVEVDGLLRRRLLLVYAIHLLADGGSGERAGAWRIEKVMKAVVEWEKGEEGEEDRGLKLANILYHKAVTRGFTSPGKVHKYSGAAGHMSASGRTVLAVEAVFALVRGILLTFLSPAGTKPAAADLEMPVVPDAFAWAGVYKELQAAISACSDREHHPSVLEFEAVKSRTKELIEAVNRADTSSCAASAARELENAVDDLTRGLEGLAEAVIGLFRSVLRSRDAALESLRVAGNANRNTRC